MTKNFLSETEIEVFDAWLEARDKEEYVQLGLQVFPELTNEKLEEMFEETQKELDPEVCEKISREAHEHFLKLCEEFQKEMASKS